MKIDSYSFVLKQILSNPRSYFQFVLFFILYQVLATLIQGFSLFTSFYSTMVPILQKVEVTPHIFESALLGIPPVNLLFQTIIAILFSLNLTLLTQKLSKLRSPSPKIGIGAGILSVAVAGCSACGISLLAILGLSTALASLPFQGLEILTLTILILFATLFYNIRALSLSCKIEKKS